MIIDHFNFQMLYLDTVLSLKGFFRKQGPVHTLAFSTDGRFLASAGECYLHLYRHSVYFITLNLGNYLIHDYTAMKNLHFNYIIAVGYSKAT